MEMVEDGKGRVSGHEFPSFPPPQNTPYSPVSSSGSGARQPRCMEVEWRLVEAMDGAFAVVMVEVATGGPAAVGRVSAARGSCAKRRWKEPTASR